MFGILRYLLLFAFFSLGMAISAQTTKWQDMHKVKRKETIFGIAQQYGLTVEDLIKANPEMNTPGYNLKKGDYIFIPYPSNVTTNNKQPVTAVKSVTNNTLRLGVMLPLHDINGDGHRMVEYYRGVLMACDSLKHEGININVHAWNLSEDANVNKIINDPAAAKCDVIIGPLYSSQAHDLAVFAQKKDIKLFIPFSISTPDLYTNGHVMQVYQSGNELNESVIAHFIDRFRGYHPVIIDCNDTTSKKGQFTFSLRRNLEAAGIAYSITNLKSSEEMFAKAFSTTQANVVILNTGRSPELNVAMAKLDNLQRFRKQLKISLFGYTEWLMYTKYVLDQFYQFDTYIPSTFYYNPLSSYTVRLEQKYRRNFRSEMMTALPRFAITGFDHTYFLLKGLQKQGKAFVGAVSGTEYLAIQNPLNFKKIGNGGYQNKTLMFVHYSPDHKITLINY